MGSFILPRLADLYGRKTIYYSALSLFFFTSFFYPWVTQLNYVYVLLFLGGFSEAGRYYVGFVYMQELMPTAYQAQIGINVFIVHSFAKLFYDIYFYRITRNWVYLSYFSIIVSGLVLTSYFWIPESPRWLIASNQNAKADEAFAKIE